MLQLVLIALISLLASLASADCDAGCQAYVWGYPLWQAVNVRYLQNANSPNFAQNTFIARVSKVPGPGETPQFVLCNATLCSSTPSLLNPSPIVAPNVDTIYGAFPWDLGQLGPGNPGGAIKLVLPSNALIRYASAILYDHYTNVLLEVSSVNQPFNQSSIFCLTQLASHPACASLKTQTGGLSQTIVVPRFGFSIIRVYSSGLPTGVCGVDGCQYLGGVIQNFGVIFAPTNLKYYNVTYGPYMALNPTVPGSTCPYYLTQAPCGVSGNKNAFWDAICVAISDNHVTAAAEATYVENTFGPFGIHATGCDTTLNYAALNAGLTAGYEYVAANIENTGVLRGPWYAFPFGGAWNVQDLSSSLQRAVAATRAIFINANSQAVYWIASKDSDGNPLTGEWGTTYKIVWRSSDPIVNAQRGFWSVTLYDLTKYLYIPPEGTDKLQYAIRGTGVPAAEIHLSNVCVTSNCIRANPGLFAIALRAYVPLPNVLPNGNYVFPDIVKCDCHSPCY
jgi:hypothetical protein